MWPQLCASTSHFIPPPFSSFLYFVPIFFATFKAASDMTARIACLTQERQVVHESASKPAISKSDGNAVWHHRFRLPLSTRTDELLVMVDDKKMGQTVARASVALQPHPLHKQRRLKLECGNASSLYLFFTIYV